MTMTWFALTGPYKTLTHVHQSFVPSRHLLVRSLTSSHYGPDRHADRSPGPAFAGSHGEAGDGEDDYDGGGESTISFDRQAVTQLQLGKRPESGRQGRGNGGWPLPPEKAIILTTSRQAGSIR